MNRGEKLLLGGAAVAVAGMVALAAPVVVSFLPEAQAAAEQTHMPVPKETYTPRSLPDPTPTLTAAQIAAQAEHEAWEARVVAVTPDQWATACAIIDRAWSANYMGDPELGADLLVEAERSFGADGYVLSALRGWDGEYLNVNTITFDVENGQCLMRNGTPTQGIACEGVGYDRGPILRAEGYVTARNAAGIAISYEVARGDSWERIAERFCYPDTAPLRAANENQQVYSGRTLNLPG
ncbi:hypothetical protein PFZ49_09815 [Microbacterium lacticum]|uniref:hypothetical protein n=1 Tax=Microbacterium lacticum TaxID=33885 RepID=UPI003A85D723